MKKNYLNLSLRSIFHIFISGSLFYFIQNKFHISVSFGVLSAFLTASINELFENVRKIENSFNTKHAFKRDRILAALSIFYTGFIIKIHWLFATLLAPISLLALTSYIDKKGIENKVGPRNLIKPIFDIASFTLGPLACVALLAFLR